MQRKRKAIYFTDGFEKTMVDAFNHWLAMADKENYEILSITPFTTGNSKHSILVVYSYRI